MLRRVFDPWRHPSTWWTLTHLVTDIVVGAVTFTVVITLLALSLGLLVTFFLAIPVFWLLMVVSRGFAHLERSRLAALLGVDLPDPVPPLQGPSWWRRLLERARSGARWKEVAYLLLLLPLGALDLVLVTIAWCGSLALLALPFYVSALPEGTAKFSFFDVGSGGDAWLVAAVGLLGLVLFAPWVTVVLGRLDAVAAAWFLGPDERAAQRARVRAAERGRVAAVGSAEAERRRIERDLHDGAQQRLVSLAMDLGRGPGALRRRPRRRPMRWSCTRTRRRRPRCRSCATWSAGSTRSILEDRGLDAALSAVVARAPIPVSLEVHVEPRPSAEIESTAYFVVSEALTNVASHSGATNAAVVARTRRRCARGRGHATTATGGADAGDGTGLAGLGDRVDVARRMDARGEPAPAGRRPCGRCCRAHRDRRGLRAAPRRAHPPARRRGRGRGRRGSVTPRRCSPRSTATAPTSPSSTSACRRRYTDEGVRAARADPPAVARRRRSSCSRQYVEERYASDLLAGDTGGVGYLLKDRVADVARLRRGACGASVTAARRSTPRWWPAAGPEPAARTRSTG